MGADPKLNVAIVAHFAYGAMTGGAQGHVGGVERQTSLLARWLAARGHKVSLLTWDEGQGDEVMIDGVRVISICRADEGIRGLRFFVPRWSGLIRALNRADADVCYHNCAEYVTGQIALWCRMRNRRFVFSVASDIEVEKELGSLEGMQERYLYRYGLRKAHRVVLQTDVQRNALKENFGIDGDVLAMACPGPSDAQYLPRSQPSQQSVLWVGRIAPVKRVEFLLEVARRLPDVRFRVAGMPYEGDPYSSSMLEALKGMPNIEYLGAVPRERMPELYGAASLLCCTSAYEGFPNTFIEAWSHGLPVVSTVDPDGLIQKNGLGAQATSEEAVARQISALLADSEGWRRSSAAARAHYMSRYPIDTAMARFEELFRGVAAGRFT